MLIAIDNHLINVDNVIRVVETYTGGIPNIRVHLINGEEIFFADMTNSDFRNLANGDPF